MATSLQNNLHLFPSDPLMLWVELGRPLLRSKPPSFSILKNQSGQLGLPPLPANQIVPYGRKPVQ